jgi:glycosyltransferase involved in cell wall biosynthesis
MIKNTVQFIRYMLYVAELVMLSAAFFGVYYGAQNFHALYKFDFLPGAEIVQQPWPVEAYIRAYWLVMAIWAILLWLRDDYGRRRVQSYHHVFISHLLNGCIFFCFASSAAFTFILQKSLKEGFGLTITEALWKGKPVIAGAVGGIPLQITHRHSGILTHSIEGAAYWIKRLLQDPAGAKRLGENGREHVRQNFILTRQLRDYLLLALSMQYPGQDVVHF